MLGLLRAAWPTRGYTLLGALGGAAVVAVAAPSTFVVVGIITLGFLYPIHRLTCWLRATNRNEAAHRVLVPASIAVLVTLLVATKAYRFFTIPWISNEHLTAHLVSLIGFSYYLFRAINFLYIQSLLKLDERTPWGLLFFTFFPPTLTSGPIHKYQDFRSQLGHPEPLSKSLLTQVGYRLTRGYFRKVVVAFMLNEWSTRLLAIENPTIYISVLSITVLYLYFYFDFAGYSDIAIALGLLLGIKVPENFRKPFSATTVSEFWRNWHITLVDWFRDHVFIPLGGMKGSRLHAGVLALLIMVLCGLWHGITLNFLIWGAWHGVALLLEAISGTKPIPPSLRHGPHYWWRVFWTNSRVALACILFLPDTQTILRILGGFARFA